MGLDMYAHRRHYVKQWDHQREEDRYTVDIKRGGKPVHGIQIKRISTVEEEVMYWRKANHIHKWFVDNVQNGIDDNCGASYRVQIELVGELLEVCDQVIEASKLVDGMVQNGEKLDDVTGQWVPIMEPGKLIEDPTVAMKLLPTQKGFFFGHYGYGEYYLNDVIETRDWAKHMLDESNNGSLGEIYYSSSW